MGKGLFNSFDDVWLLDGVRTPMVDYCGALADASPTDLGIKVAREILRRTGISPNDVDSVLAANVAPGGFDQFYLPRHIGLYAGVPSAVPALMVQRICGSGLELVRQAGEQIGVGSAECALLVGTESMSRHPVMAFEHRQGFKLGASVAFKDYLWESLTDTSRGISMIHTAENLARRHCITREEVDAYASQSFDRAVRAQESGWFDPEIVPVEDEVFVLDGGRPRGIRLAAKGERAERDTHPRLSPPDVLARLRAIYPGGVQTGGNSAALTDGAAAALVASGNTARAWSGRPLARVAAAAVVGVAPEIMGIGPVPAIRLLLERAGLRMDNISRFEINEAQGAQIVAVHRQLDLDPAKLNVHGGAIALGHPLAATGLRLVVTVARQLRAMGARFGIAAACIGGGQGIAMLVENADSTPG